MPLTFKQYLKKNKISLKKPNTFKPGWGWWPGLGIGYYHGYDNPHNSQSTGDISDGGTIGGYIGVEGEEKIPVPGLPADEFPNEDSEENQQYEDPNKQGLIRTVKGAKLVYKRQTDDGTFEELWIYNIGNINRDEYEIRKDILAGTDIPLNKVISDDGTQEYELWTIGNAQIIKISGLPN